MPFYFLFCFFRCSLLVTDFVKRCHGYRALVLDNWYVFHHWLFFFIILDIVSNSWYLVPVFFPLVLFFSYVKLVFFLFCF